MQYQDIIKAEFIERPNRFIARVLVKGAEEKAHVKNTGRCKELLVPGCTVYLEDHINRMGSRKMRYSLIATEKLTDEGTLLINMDSQAPNKIAAEGFRSRAIEIPGLEKLEIIKAESTFGNSRFDFFLQDVKGRKAYAEIKGCTLEDHGVASFPDAPTERGVKHIEELIEAHKQGFEAAIIFIIQMEGMKYIRPNDETHKAFGDALRKAKACGVNVLAYECAIEPDKCTITKEIAVKLN